MVGQTPSPIQAVSHPAVVVCVGCGWFGVGVVYEEAIVPTGVRTCPDCGGEEWSEFVDGDGGWPSEE